MTLQAVLTGQLASGPAAASDNAFPNATNVVPFTLNPPTRQYQTATGGVVQVNSPVAFESLPGIGGAVGPVTQALILYVRVLTPMQVRLTYLGDVTAKVAYVDGLLILETDPTHPITLLEVQGAGQVEFYAFGNQ